MLRLLRPEAAEHLGALHITRAEVVENDERADRFGCFVGCRIEQRRSQDESDLQLEVERLRIVRDRNRRAGGYESLCVGHVIDRLTVEQRLRLELGHRPAGDPFVQRSHAVQAGVESSDQATGGIDVVLFVQHEVTERHRLERQQLVAVLKLPFGCCREPGVVEYPAAQRGEVGTICPITLGIKGLQAQSGRCANTAQFHRAPPSCLHRNAVTCSDTRSGCSSHGQWPVPGTDCTSQ